MSDRIKGLIVVLEPDRRDDDAAPIVNAIRLLHGVVSVRSLVADIDSHIATENAKLEIRAALWRALNEYGRQP